MCVNFVHSMLSSEPEEAWVGGAAAFCGVGGPNADASASVAARTRLNFTVSASSTLASVPLLGDSGGEKLGVAVAVVGDIVADVAVVADGLLLLLPLL